ncbi:MAG: Holliday junction resolvase RuvX [Clostridia bacterium]|nr:Holliday junction resolvase RuvX [Clostridia bacterium]
MRKIAFDVGDVRIGIATSDPTGIIASGYETFTRTKSLDKDMKYLASVVKERQCDEIIIGLPLNMDGTEGRRVEIVREFGEKFKKYVGIDVLYQDERLSTVSAEKALIESGMRRDKRKTVIDKVAASIILQSYLDKINTRSKNKMKDEKNDVINDVTNDENDVEMIEEDEVVTLTDDDGKDTDFYVLAELDYKDKWYIYLEPVELNEEYEEGEIIIFELGENEEGEEIFIPIKDEKLLQEVFELFMSEMETGDEE